MVPCDAVPVHELHGAVERMVAALTHRGPDDRGQQAITHSATGRIEVVVGSTRLAILDLSRAGHQPMHDERTGNWIVFNGEIYNHRAIRAALPSEEWTSTTDTEAVLRAYAAWGPRCLDRLRGMFAFAVWDARRGDVFCARDRLGIKPFYYSTGDDRVTFASEVRSLLASGLVTPRLDARGIAEFVRFGSVPEPVTLIDGVRSLPAGHWMRIRRGRITAFETYWRPDRTHRPASREDAVATVRRRLTAAVEEHLVSDVPVGSFLSGGIDSSVITALAALRSTRPLRTFTLAFPGSPLDESRFAESVAARWGTEHHRMVLSEADVVSAVPRAVHAMDLPSIDGINTYLVARAAAASGTKVVLSGLGGDELFGGYRTFRLLPVAGRWAPLVGHYPKFIARAIRGSRGRRTLELFAAGRPLRERYATLRALWAASELEEMHVAPRIRAVNGGEVEHGRDTASPSRISWLELTGYMRNTLLRDADAMSMAHSVELRVPFLDHRLVESCLQLNAAASPRSAGKALLLAATRDLLPPGLGARPKQGFVLPLASWMRGPLRRFVADGVERLIDARALPGADVTAFAHRFYEGRLSWARLWQFVVLGHWIESSGARPA